MISFKKFLVEALDIKNFLTTPEEQQLYAEMSTILTKYYTKFKELRDTEPDASYVTYKSLADYKRYIDNYTNYCKKIETLSKAYEKEFNEWNKVVTINGKRDTKYAHCTPTKMILHFRQDTVLSYKDVIEVYYKRYKNRYYELQLTILNNHYNDIKNCQQKTSFKAGEPIKNVYKAIKTLKFVNTRQRPEDVKIAAGPNYLLIYHAESTLEMEANETLFYGKLFFFNAGKLTNTQEVITYNSDVRNNLLNRYGRRNLNISDPDEVIYKTIYPRGEYSGVWTGD